jgi:hypothetical protein
LAKFDELVFLDQRSVDWSSEYDTTGFGSQSSQNHITSSVKITGPSKQYLKEEKKKDLKT